MEGGFAISLIGYARVSSRDQDLGVQVDALRAEGCDRIFQEKRSGATAEDREAWQECLEFMREGDILMFTRLDRIGRSLADLAKIGEILREKGVEIRCLQQQVDTTSAEGRLLWGILATFAEFELDIRKGRQREGIDRARQDGTKYKGRKRKVTKERVAELKATGLGATAIARELRCDRTAIYRAHPNGWGPRPHAQ